MKTTRMAIACLCTLVLISLLFSCARSGRKPLDLTSTNQITAGDAREGMVIKFEESLPGKPLNQTVWDNVTGPFWDVEESKRIGFTQHYKPQFFLISPSMLPVFAKAGINLNDTQIIIPFGNILARILESSARKNFQTTLCFDESCIAGESALTILRIKIDKFLVWEAPVNHLNLYVKGKSTYSRSGVAVREHGFERTMLNQRVGGLLSSYSRSVDEKVGSLLTTPNTFMDEMNRLSNRFAEAVSVEILSKAP